MKKKLVSVLLIATAAIFMLAGCQKGEVKDEKESKETITVTDFRGKDVTINYPAKRVVCLLNSGLNDIYMLGAKDAVVGIDKWTYDTEEIYNITSKLDERVADKSLPAVDGSVEKIVALKPDVVIAWSESEEIKALEEQGIKVVGVQVNNFKDVETKMNLIGQIVGKEDRAKEIIDYTNKKLDETKNIVSSIPEDKKLTSVFTWGPTDLDFAGNDSTGNTILEYSGLENAAKEVTKEHFVASMENAVKWNPESIVIWNSQEVTPETYYNDIKWKDVEGVKNKKIVQMPSAFYCDLWTVKYLNAINIVANTFYPEEMGNKNIEKEQKDLMKFLYNKEI
ncbi:ABC transporter substrate-binding protein [Romboutsia sp.]|uniref:ABC transporter substrate-binding protein n=1 Tax=Romboutsia sp. TaxID=1965302 RepID=UPI003F388EBC